MILIVRRMTNGFNALIDEVNEKRFEQFQNNVYQLVEVANLTRKETREKVTEIDRCS